MKPLLFILCVLTFASCNLLKRSVTERKASNDSTYTTTSGTTSVVKEQSNKNRQSTTTTRKGTDSGYSRTTLIKEYFSDEFDFDTPAKDGTAATGKGKVKADATSSAAGDYFPPNPEQRKLRYRETTVTENGRLLQSVQKERVAENVNGTSRSDSSVVHQQDQVNVNTSEETSAKQTQKRKLFPGWAIGLGIFVIVLILICWYKKASPLQLWQSLTKRTK